MAITFDSSRQYPLVAKVTFTYADLTSATDIEVVKLPSGARVVGGQVGITTAFNSATSDTLDAGDGTTQDRYASNIDAQALGVTALTLGQTAHATGEGSVYLNNTQVGTAATAGAGFIEVWYVIDGRGNEVQPT